MGWKEFYQRRDIADAALRQAARNPKAPLPFAEIPGAIETFGTEEQLLLAWQYRWSLLLSGYLRTEFEDETDRVDAVTRAWNKAARNHRTLREVLDAHVDRYPALRRMHEAELRTLAVAAGLGEPGEPELTKVGATFVALLRHGPKVQAPPRKPLGQLRRMLAPSA